MSRLLPLLATLATLALALTLLYFSLYSTPSLSNSPFDEHRALSTTRDLSTRFPARHVSSMDSVRTASPPLAVTLTSLSRHSLDPNAPRRTPPSISKACWTT